MLFQTASGEKMERPMCCVPCSFEVNNADGEIEAKREQVSFCRIVAGYTFSGGPQLIIMQCRYRSSSRGL